MPRLLLLVLMGVILTGCSAPGESRVQTKPYPPPPPYVYTFPVSKNVPDVGKGVVMLNECATAGAVGARYIYNYWINDPHCVGVEWLPMLSGRTRVFPDIGSASKLLLLNEPDRADQSNVSPSDAIAWLYAAEEFYAGVTLVSPAPSHLGMRWLDEARELFYAEYGRYPRWGVIAMHCYFADVAGMNNCKNLVLEYSAKADAWGAGELWLTEFACVTGEPACVGLEDEFIEWLKVRAPVKRYYHFIDRWLPDWGSACTGCERYALSDEIYALTALGRMYKVK